MVNIVLNVFSNFIVKGITKRGIMNERDNEGATEIGERGLVIYILLSQKRFKKLRSCCEFSENCSCQLTRLSSKISRKQCVEFQSSFP